jgi:hypothetical protein
VVTARCAAVADADLSYFTGDYLHDILEVMLLELGGQQLLDDAHREAAAHVEAHYSWDGVGDEPGARASAYCAVLWQRAQLPNLADR